MLINGIDLFVSIKKAEQAKAAVVIVHGIAEHSGRYEKMRQVLHDAHYHVISYDLRGHGQSMGERGRLNHYLDMVEDLQGIVKVALKLHERVFILGHSLGGLITHMYAVTYHDIEGVITSGAPTDYIKDVMPFRIIGYKWLGKFYKKTNFADNQLSRIKEVERMYAEDPYNLKKMYFSLIGHMMIGGVAYLKKNINKHQTNTLLLHGGADKIVPATMSEALYEKLTIKDKTLKIYPESYHEIYNDLNQDEVFQDTIEWLNDRTN
jgi:acylglycerol lipase